MVSMIRVKPGMINAYLRDVLPPRKKVNEEAKPQGLVISSHVLSGSATGRDDFDAMFLEEHKNWATLAGLAANYDAIAAKIVGTEDKQVQLMTQRVEVRETYGDKVIEGLIIKGWDCYPDSVRPFVAEPVFRIREGG